MKLCIDSGAKHTKIESLKKFTAVLDAAMEAIGLSRIDVTYTDYHTYYEYMRMPNTIVSIDDPITVKHQG